MRLRIIIVVFIVVVVFYFFQFVLNMMKKKEHFSTHYYDDVERYEDPPQSKTEEEYAFRVSMLDEIDKLNISDNKLKGAVMEAVFSDVTSKKLQSMSKEKRTEEIRNIYQAALNDGKTVAQEQKPIEKPVVEKKSVSEHLKDYIDNATLPVPVLKDYYENDFRNKASKAMDKLDTVIESLADMKNILNGKQDKEPYIPDLPIPGTLPTKEDKDDRKQVIEGFENIREYASFNL